MSVEAMVQAMIDDLTAALVDAAKHDKGNSAAGTRVRKAMQEARLLLKLSVFKSKTTRTTEARLTIFIVRFSESKVYQNRWISSLDATMLKTRHPLISPWKTRGYG